MKKKLKHEFVEFIPDQIEEGVLYVSMEYGTAVHKCACGCGNEVVTPLSPTDWKLTYDGESVSLNPSIGNWNFECQSHYWVEDGFVSWAKKWSEKQIIENRIDDQESKSEYYDDSGPTPWYKRLFGWL